MPDTFRSRFAIILHTICVPTVLFCAVLPGASSKGASAPPKPSAPPVRHGREMQAIDGAWKFQTDPNQVGEALGWTKSAPSTAATTQVPSLWTAGSAPNYSGVAWYWREFDVPSRWKGQTVRLRFEAAADSAHVWLNGEKLGEHRDGATPFEFNITKGVHIGGRNLVAVSVDGNARTGPGLWQGVLLMAHDEAYITDVFAYAGGLGDLTAQIRLLNTSEHSGDATLDAHIAAVKTPTRDLKTSQQNLSLTPNLNVTTFVVNAPKKKINLWSPETPALYYLQLAFRQEKDVLDTTETTFGFREFGWKDGAITLNGQPIILVASAPQLEKPVVIATEEDSATARALLKKLKNGGVSVLYLDAPPPALLSLADEEGLLVVEGARPDLKGDEAAREMADLIQRDRSHASILAWNLRDAPEEVRMQARKLDSTRFLLAGTGKAMQMWLPRSEDTTPVAPPASMIPR